MADPVSPATEEFGRRLREHRHKLKLTQEDLAEASDLHWTYIGQVERGERNVSLRNLLKLAEAVEVELGVLTDGLRGW